MIKTIIVTYHDGSNRNIRVKGSDVYKTVDMIREAQSDIITYRAKDDKGNDIPDISWILFNPKNIVNITLEE